MSKKETGLFLGKFAPLHKGHQYVIETALKEVEDLVVVIYGSPEVTDTPLNVRADWIRKLYPKVIKKLSESKVKIENRKVYFL